MSEPKQLFRAPVSAVAQPKRPLTQQGSLQPKTAGGQPQQQRPAANQSRRAPVAPPVYRPQPVPRVLQTKMASNQQTQPGQSPRQPIAPPVYRPEPKKIVQPKMASAAQARKPPTAPPVYRPNSEPKVLQAKASQRSAASVAQYNPTKAQGQKLPGQALQQRATTPRFPVQTKVQPNVVQRSVATNQRPPLGRIPAKAPQHDVRARVGTTIQQKSVGTTSSARKVFRGQVTIQNTSCAHQRRPSGLIQMMEDTGSGGWSYEKYVAQHPNKELRQSASEQAQAQAKELAKKAFLHMRSLVIKYNKDGTKGSVKKEDRDSLYIYGPNDDSAKNIGAVTYSNSQVMIATNSSIPQTGVSSFQNYYPNKTVVTVRNTQLTDNALCMHAEIKLFQTSPNVEYIGVSKLCCLYCAAQLLARGFTGFRGCSMVAFNNYQWMNEVSDHNFRVALWGGEVAGVLKDASVEILTLFMFHISQGSTLMQSLQQSSVIHNDYTDNKHPLYDVYPDGYPY